MRSLVLFSAAVVMFAAHPALAEGRYVNPRFGYAICVPDGLAAQGEADNGDGQAFEAADGARLIVYGGHNALDETLAQRRAATLERLGPASYASGGRGWFVLSGRTGGDIYYVRTALRADVFVAFEFTYPAAAKGRWNPVAARLSSCFEPSLSTSVGGRAPSRGEQADDDAGRQQAEGDGQRQGGGNLLDAE